MTHFSQQRPNQLSTNQVLKLAAYMTKLANECSHEVGFVPNTVYPKAVLRNQVTFSVENNELCGFLLHGPPRHEMRIYQTAIDYDCRRLEHGTHAVNQVIKKALEEDQEKIILHCAADLPANAFWRAAGFVPRGDRHLQHASRRHEVRWEMLLPRGEDLERFLSEQKKTDSQMRILALFGKTAALLALQKDKFRSQNQGSRWTGRPQTK